MIRPVECVNCGHTTTLYLHEKYLAYRASPGAIAALFTRAYLRHFCVAPEAPEIINPSRDNYRHLYYKVAERLSGQAVEEVILRSERAIKDAERLRQPIPEPALD